VIQVVVGDLAEQAVEGLVRPVRSDLAPVSAASRDVGVAAGEELEERLARLGTLPVGGAVLTPAGALRATYLIHVVVMSEEESQTPLSVQRALRNGLRRASDWGLASIALPPLGLSVGLIEPEESARALVEILFNHLDEGAQPLDLSIVVASDFESRLFEGLIDEMSRVRSSARN
jgi:O-acetyl-ADP-ribose deacetylase (regulator of RNase III)